MSQRVSARRIWGESDSPLLCEHCREYPATVFLSTKYSPEGHPEAFYLCPRCFLGSMVSAMDAVGLVPVAQPIDITLTTDSDPREVLRNEQQAKERDWRN